jgi:hypothetical protein
MSNKHIGEDQMVPDTNEQQIPAVIPMNEVVQLSTKPAATDFNTRPTSNRINVSNSTRLVGRVTGLSSRLSSVAEYISKMSQDDLKKVFRNRGENKTPVLVEHELNDRVMFADHMISKLESLFQVSTSLDN